jgi:hypothetical protein
MGRMDSVGVLDDVPDGQHRRPLKPKTQPKYMFQDLSLSLVAGAVFPLLS